MDDRSSDVNKLKQERQKLLGLIRSLECDIEDLKRQISGHEQTSNDKVDSKITIKGMMTGCSLHTAPWVLLESNVL